MSNLSAGAMADRIAHALALAADLRSSVDDDAKLSALVDCAVGFLVDAGHEVARVGTPAVAPAPVAVLVLFAAADLTLHTVERRRRIRLSSDGKRLHPSRVN